MSIENVDQRKHMFDRPVAQRHRDPDQQYCVMTVVAPKGCNQKCKELMIKVYGCKATLEEANEWAKRLRDSNDFLDVYTLKTCEWALMPPSLDRIDTIRYTDSRIQSIRDSYVDHLRGEKADMAERLEEVQNIKKQDEKTKSQLRKERAKYFNRNGKLKKGKTLPPHLRQGYRPTQGGPSAVSDDEDDGNNSEIEDVVDDDEVNGVVDKDE